MSSSRRITASQWTLYQRQTAVLGRATQLKLMHSTVMVVGLGGLGVPAVTELALCGVGTLVLNDFDVIELANLSRQFLYCPDDIMSAKVSVAARALRRLRPDMNVTEIDGELDESQMRDRFSQVDAVLDCTDNFESRFTINRAARAAGVPLISASALKLAGQLAVFDFRRPDSPCYQCLFPALDARESDCNRAGIIAPVLGVIASMQVMETLRIIAQERADAQAYFYRYRADGHSFSRSRIEQDPACAVCRPGGAVESATLLAAGSSAILSVPARDRSVHAQPSRPGAAQGGRH